MNGGSGNQPRNASASAYEGLKISANRGFTNVALIDGFVGPI
jgi:hypothetical protein